MVPKAHIEALTAASESRLKSLKSVLRRYVLLRLAVFIVFATAAYFTWYAAGLTWAILIAGAASFLLLVKRHAEARDGYLTEKAYHALCTEELAIAEGHWRDRRTGSAYADPAHPYSSDLNIFGKHSLFQLLNRCQSHEGEAVLASWLSINLTDPSAIEAERASIAHFAERPEWGLRFLAAARRSAASKGEEVVVDGHWTTRIPAFDSVVIRALFTRVLPAVMLLLSAAHAFSLLSWNAYLLCLLGAGALGAAFLKKHQAVFQTWTALSSGVAAYERMLNLLRGRDFAESPFREKLKDTSLDQSAAALESLQKISGAIDSRNNLVVGLVLNVLLFWDFQCMLRLQRWQQRYGALMPQWLGLLNEVEAYQSMALYRFQHPEHIDPKIVSDAGIVCDSATHPLLGKEAVPNAVGISGHKQFAIITGANMAGKSTYLRMVGLLAVMAMRGLPVPAKGMAIGPAQLFTSMLTTDSLGDQASYFFSELRRLRQIVDALERGHPHFIILDEILKGTNSIDKAEGSRRFLLKLLRLELANGQPAARGLIATHDLSLCTMADTHSQEIENLSFEVEFENGQLAFDYRLRQGVCQNMNASFLLEEMGLT